MNGFGKMLGVDSDEAMDLARRGVAALEKMADSLAWLRDEVDRHDLLGQVAQNQHDRWQTP